MITRHLTISADRDDCLRATDSRTFSSAAGEAEATRTLVVCRGASTIACIQTDDVMVPKRAAWVAVVDK